MSDHGRSQQDVWVSKKAAAKDDTERDRTGHETRRLFVLLLFNGRCLVRR